MLYLGGQWTLRQTLNRRVYSLPSSVSQQQVEAALGLPDSRFDPSPGRTIYCYGFGMPLALLEPQEWQLEFSNGKLKDKTLCFSP